MNFGLYANTKRLFNTDPPKGDHLSCLDGIRFLSITWVMMGHILSGMLGQGFPTSNVATLFGLFQRFEFQAVNNAFVSVDTFFLMSGCLVSYLMLSGHLSERQAWTEVVKIKNSDFSYWA